MNYAYKLSLCVIIKNEIEFIDEFLEHYVNQGVDHFFIINNNSSDGIENFIANHKYENKITLISDNRPFQHIDMLNKIYYLLKNTSEWGIILDIDEFIFGKNGYTISSYINELENDINAVYIYWNLFKPAIDLCGNIIEPFSIRNSNQRINLDLLPEIPYETQWSFHFGKSLFRTSALIDERKFWIHKIPIYGKRITNYNTLSISCNDNDDDINKNEENYKNSNITMNHYAIRNKNSYLSRINKLNTEIDKNQKLYAKSLLNWFNLSSDYFVTDNELCELYEKIV